MPQELKEKGWTIEQIRGRASLDLKTLFSEVFVGSAGRSDKMDAIRGGSAGENICNYILRGGYGRYDYDPVRSHKHTSTSLNYTLLPQSIEHLKVMTLSPGGAGCLSLLEGLHHISRCFRVHRA